MELAGKHVVITGAGSGIGRACAARFMREGARVVVSDSDRERAETVAGEIGATAVVADVAREVATAVVEGLRDERFLILPHEQVAAHMALKGAQPERWLAGMRRLVREARTQSPPA